MKKRLALVLAAVLVVMVLAGCGSTPADTAAAGAQNPSVVNIGTTLTLASANPLQLDQAELSKIVMDLQFQPLCELNGELEFVNVLAESITTEDNIHFYVTLNENARWSDGEPITAEDVEFSVLKYASPIIGNGTLILYVFEGTDDETGFTEAGAESISGVQVVDERTVCFTAKYEIPLTTFQNSYGRYLHILPKHALAGMSDEELRVTAWFDSPEVVSGPYRLVSYDTEHFMTFAKNENYWDGPANIDVLNILVEDASQLYASLSAGEIDFIQQTTADIPFDDYENIRALPNVKAVMGSTITNQSLFIQCANITDARIRQAILCGVDRQTLVSGFLQGCGEVIDGFVSSASPFYDASLVPTAYDKDRAAQLVAEAAADGYDVSRPIRFYTNSGDGTMTNAAAYMVSGLQEIGLNVEIHTVDFATLMAVAGTPEVDMFAVQYTYCPVDYYPDVAWLLSGEGSWTGYADEELDAALADSQAAGSAEQIRADLLTVDTIVQRDCPMISLYVQSAMGVVSTRLQNALPNVYGSFVNVSEWTLAE